MAGTADRTDARRPMPVGSPRAHPRRRAPDLEGLLMLNDVITALRATDIPLAAAGYELGVGRTVPTAAAVVGLAAVVVVYWPWLARARAGGPSRPWCSGSSAGCTGRAPPAASAPATVWPG